jgi:hypothetical protein
MTLSGNPTIPLSCGHTLDVGFVYDLDEYAEDFEEMEVTCPVCPHKGRYSRKNLVLIPAKNPLKE